MNLKEEAIKKTKKVYVCSPYGGKIENFVKAVEYCMYVAEMGHIPFASHVMLHGIIADTGEEREKGLSAGLEMLKIADEIWVFGVEVTSGMADEMRAAKKLGIPVVYINMS